MKNRKLFFKRFVMGIVIFFMADSCGFFVCTAGSFLRGTGLSVKAGGAGRYEPGFGEGNTKCKE